MAAPRHPQALDAVVQKVLTDVERGMTIGSGVLPGRHAPHLNAVARELGEIIEQPQAASSRVHDALVRAPGEEIGREIWLNSEGTSEADDVDGAGGDSVDHAANGSEASGEHER